MALAVSCAFLVVLIPDGADGYGTGAHAVTAGVLLVGVWLLLREIGAAPTFRTTLWRSLPRTVRALVLSAAIAIGAAAASRVLGLGALGNLHAELLLFAAGLAGWVGWRRIAAGISTGAHGMAAEFGCFVGSLALMLWLSRSPFCSEGLMVWGFFLGQALHGFHRPAGCRPGPHTRAARDRFDLAARELRRLLDQRERNA